MDLRTERAHINTGYDWWQSNLGEAVAWFEYDAVNSSSHSVYDEPTVDATRIWKPVIFVPVLWVIRSEDDELNTEEGRTTTDTLRLAVPMDTLRKVGLSKPDDAARHLRDLIVYNRTYWNVGSYQRRGRLRSSNVIVGVNCTRVYESDDMPFDSLPAMPDNGLVTRPGGFPTDGYAAQSFPDYEKPAFPGT